MSYNSKYDTDKIKTFDNEVLSVAFKNQLTTKMDMNQFITMNYELAEEPGMVKKIRTYSGTGNVEDLAMGAKNSVIIGSEWVESEYEVKVTQGTVKHYDEQQMADPNAIDKAIEHLSEKMINDNTAKIVAELDKGSHKVLNFDYSFDMIAEAISMLPEESNDGLYLMIARKDIAKFQKKLNDSLKYVEAFVRTGYIGHICGVPVYANDAVPTGKAYLATREAVTCFMKRGASVETARDIEARANTIVGNIVRVIALTNDDKVIVLSAAAA